MEGFAWAENNLGADTPDTLQSKGVDVFVAPNIEPDRQVVNLSSGQINMFQLDQQRPQQGYYADWESLTRYCREQNIPLSETNGLASVQRVGFDEAGNPLLHGEP